MNTSLASLYQRDLQKVGAELLLYPDEVSVWALSADISNSAGTLVLHLVGNLKKFIGDQLFTFTTFSILSVPSKLLLETAA